MRHCSNARGGAEGTGVDVGEFPPAGGGAGAGRHAGADADAVRALLVADGFDDVIQGQAHPARP
ncbi:MAG: hypothetical protein MZU91_10285 [Desulfosudis oleivorans]|nr:hypothetical protein [Desulfosudis oleivorans]